MLSLRLIVITNTLTNYVKFTLQCLTMTRLQSLFAFFGSLLETDFVSASFRTILSTSILLSCLIRCLACELS